MVLVFADDYREKHPLALQFSSNLDALCQRDYGCSYFNQVINCLDMDAYETSCLGRNDCTMDASVGIGTYEMNTVSNKRFLLVELRLGYKSPNNLDYNNMSQKISHTRDILSGSLIHDEYYFIFPSKVAPMAKNYFERKRRENDNMSSWVAMSPDEFLNEIEDSSKQPYTPINNPETISRGFLQAYSQGENTFTAYFKYWMEHSSVYQLQYKLSESKSIVEALQTALNNIDSIDTSMSILVQIMKEDIELKMNSLNKK